MKIVWQITILFTTHTLFLVSMDMDQEKSPGDSFNDLIANIDQYDSKKKEGIKKSLQNIYCSPAYDKELVPFTLYGYTQEEHPEQIPHLPWKPLCTTIKEKNGQKTIQIELRNVFSTNRDTIVTANDVAMNTIKHTPLCAYKPKPGIWYTIITTNQNGSLIATGYDRIPHGDTHTNCIDIIANYKYAHLGKIMTIVLPEEQEITNICFSEDDAQLQARTKNNLYIYDIHGILQYQEPLLAAQRVVNSQESDPKEMVVALALCEAIQQKCLVYYRENQQIIEKDMNKKSSLSKKHVHENWYTTVCIIPMILIIGLLISSSLST